MSVKRPARPALPTDSKAFQWPYKEVFDRGMSFSHVIFDVIVAIRSATAIFKLLSPPLSLLPYFRL